MSEIVLSVNLLSLARRVNRYSGAGGDGLVSSRASSPHQKRSWERSCSPFVICRKCARC